MFTASHKGRFGPWDVGFNCRFCRLAATAHISPFVQMAHIQAGTRKQVLKPTPNSEAEVTETKRKILKSDDGQDKVDVNRREKVGCNAMA